MKTKIPEQTITLSTSIYIERLEHGYYATCPNFKGLHTYGDTEKEVISNAKEAIVAYVLSVLKQGEPIPCCQIIEEKKAKRMTFHILKRPAV